MRPALARLAAAPQPAPPRRPRPSHPAAARAAAAAAARPALKGQQASSPSLKIGAGEQKSLWGSWTSLSPRIRIACAAALATFAAAGLLFSDKLEAVVPAPEAQRTRSDGSKPRLLGISVVDREAAK